MRAHVDHNYPTQTPNGIFDRFDGNSFDEDIIAFDCTNGISCYDGHAGVDYYMPVNTPILAPAPGYVVWSAFSAGADPCPGGIDPNGDTGIIIVAHGNGYFMLPSLKSSFERVCRRNGEYRGYAGLRRYDRVR